MWWFYPRIVFFPYRPPTPLGRYRLVRIPAGRGLGFGAGRAPIEPGLLFFAHGNPVGGPVGTSYRGVTASDFPSYANVLGPGAPLDAQLPLAGAPIG